MGDDGRERILFGSNTAVSERTVFLGQFRLIRLQVINWGTFQGYKDLPIDERGVLFTGPSGSGKSSLMDAHSAVLLPTHDQRFNASADLTVRGAKQGTRSVADYVRGAWSETNDEHHRSKMRYLRGGKPTWSAVAATYADGVDAMTTAVVVKWFTGAETDGGSLKTMYQLHHGQFDLTALDEWAQRNFDTRWFKAAHRGAHYPETQAAYLRELRKRIGLGSSKTALSLLGKAKAMKNVGDLNFFIRENMLDEPGTFAAAQKMLDAFTPLNEAYETARRAHAQEKVLREVPDSWAAYRDSSRTQSLAEVLLGAASERYIRGVHVRAIRDALDELDQDVKAIDADLGEQERRYEEAKAAYVSLDEQLRREGQVLEDVKVRLAAAEQEVESRVRTYQGYAKLTERVGETCPEDEPAFTALRERLPQIVEQARHDRAEIEPRRHALFAASGQARKQHEAKVNELSALQSSRSLVPRREADRRERIADGAGVPVSELPYAAELIDVAGDEERWRPAAEKVLRSFALRLLVPQQHRQAVQQFVDNHDMRGVVEYSVVPSARETVAQPEPGTLASKLTVNDTHPCGPWLAGELARRFEHVCVETSADLEQHRVAVTVRGTVKLPGGHFRKDDRTALTDPASYVLGGSIGVKRAALETEVTRLAEAEVRARAEADELDQRYRQLEATIDAATQLQGYSSWTQLDHWSATSNAQAYARRIEELKADNVDLQRLEDDRGAAEQRWQSVADTRSDLRNRLSTLRTRRDGWQETLEQETGQPRTVDDETHRGYLDDVLADLEVPVTPDTIGQVRIAFRKELERRRDAADADRRYALAGLTSAIGRFVEQWPESAPDSSGDVDRSGADFAALHADIVRRRLPNAMGRFQQMISEDMVPSISVLQRAIENAGDEINSRVAMVNAGLSRVEFNPGTHLQIAYTASVPSEVKEFRGIVEALLRDAPTARRDPEKLLAQFRRVQALMTRFTDDDAEARRWRDAVLDVRSSYFFYGTEVDDTDAVVATYRNTASSSGGEQEKLVAFCLAAALSYNLADPDSDGRPHFAPLMLDEAFSKSDEAFSHQALAAFDEFGFQMIIAAPIRMSGILEPFIGQVVLVDKRVTPDGARSNASSATFGELAAAGAGN
ncbi:ATP-binding protein [Phytoactinopolyspora limicola]|uniref:ATP-binding protein n=1 Tax=Phytoactinopolyspora limicola TaxID=2715536 RepID=UPI0014092948|nr:ATP-binding protein [Phytoactinopolyspora limicola]